MSSFTFFFLNRNHASKVVVLPQYPGIFFGQWIQCSPWTIPNQRRMCPPCPTSSHPDLAAAPGCQLWVTCQVQRGGLSRRSGKLRWSACRTPTTNQPTSVYTTHALWLEHHLNEIEYFKLQQKENSSQIKVWPPPRLVQYNLEFKCQRNFPRETCIFTLLQQKGIQTFLYKHLTQSWAKQHSSKLSHIMTCSCLFTCVYFLLQTHNTRMQAWASYLSSNVHGEWRWWVLQQYAPCLHQPSAQL